MRWHRAHNAVGLQRKGAPEHGAVARDNARRKARLLRAHGFREPKVLGGGASRARVEGAWRQSAQVLKFSGGGAHRGQHRAVLLLHGSAERAPRQGAIIASQSLARRTLAGKVVPWWSAALVHWHGHSGWGGHLFECHWQLDLSNCKT